MALRICETIKNLVGEVIRILKSEIKLRNSLMSGFLIIITQVFIKS